MISRFQQKLFDECEVRPDRPTNKDLMVSVSGKTCEIMKWIHRLYLPDGIDLDCSYRIGGIYKGTELRPRFMIDISPRSRDTIKANFEQLPFRDRQFRSVMFDPPFFATTSKYGDIRYKYGGYDRPENLWESYCKAMDEIYRVLVPYGILVFKCQDFVHGRKQYLIHADIIKHAQAMKFYPKDLFIRVNSHVPIGWNHNNQNHCRKLHVYYLVFEKKLRSVRTI